MKNKKIVRKKIRHILTVGILGIMATGAVPAGADDRPPKKFEIEFGNRTGFIGSDSFVQVRENAVNGTRLEFPRLGLHAANVPFLRSTYWVNARNALAARLRYFVLDGSHSLAAPVNFNGATLAAGQTIRTQPLWYSVGLFYIRRWTPSWLPEGDVRGIAGLEYTFIDFRINGGHAAVTPGSAGTETKEGFFQQELPLPTVGIEFHRRATRSIVVEGSLTGNWINHWNSFRKEGGTVYLSQRMLETHVRLRWVNDGRFRLWHPMVGVFLYNFRQKEESIEDGNVVRLSMAGPEIGIRYAF